MCDIKSLFATFATCCVIGSIACAAPASPTHISVGYGLTSDVLPMLVAEKEGIFKQNGIEASVLPIPGGSNLNAGLFSGSLQVIMSNPAALLNAVNGGLKFVVIAGGPRMTPSNDPIALLTRSDLHYTSPRDLLGKRIAVPSFDSGIYFVFEKWMRLNGVDASKISFVESSMAQMENLLKARQVDAVTVAEPFRSKIEMDGLAVSAARYYSAVIPDQPALFWASTADWAAKNALTVRAIQLSLRQATTFIQSHPQEAKAIEKAVFNTNRAELPNPVDSVSAADLSIYYKIGQELGLYNNGIDVTKLLVSNPP